MDNGTFVVASLPGRGGVNPYVDLFYNALQAEGVKLYEEPQIDMNWAQAHFAHIDALHFHWPEYIWRGSQRRVVPSGLRTQIRARVPGAWRVFTWLDKIARSRWLGGLQRQRNKRYGIERLREFVVSARASGVTIIWTLHNLESHENWSSLDRRGFEMLATVSDLVICHSNYARTEFLARYPSNCPVIVMPHGNYDGVYPQPRPRSQVLTDLGLDPLLPVVGCIGAMRAYKGIDVAIQAVRQYQGRLQLICAGEPHGSFPLAEAERLTRETKGAVLLPHRLSDQAFADCCNACDVILLPYRKITGSGALLAALTQGRAVVASDLPYFREVLSEHSSAGALVKPGDVAALVAGIQQLLQRDPVIREHSAWEAAAQYSWSLVIKPVMDEIKRLRVSCKPRHTKDNA